MKDKNESEEKKLLTDKLFFEEFIIKMQLL
jgi:hypothetical protein